MNAILTDIETYCPNCDKPHTIAYRNHEAESAEARAAALLAERDQWKEIAETDHWPYEWQEATRLKAERDTLAAQLEAVTNAVTARNELMQAVRMFLYGSRENDPDRKRERLLALKEAYAKVAES